MPATSQRKSQPVTAFDRSHLRHMKLTAMLDEAALLFNERGYSGTSLEMLSQRLGVSKRTIYNYIKNKEQLAFECYQRTSQCALDCLEAARQTPGSSLDRLCAFIRSSISESNPPLAVQTDVHALAPELRTRLLDQARVAREQLTDLVEAGVRDGTVAECEPKIMAFALFSVVAWVPMWFSRTGRATLDEVGRAFEHVIANGLAARPDARPAVPFRMSPPLNDELKPFDRDQVGSLKQTTLVKAATALFNSHGVAGTTLDDVADSLRVTKGTLYYYFESKEELLLRCYERTLAIAHEYISRIEAETDAPLERIELALRCCIDTHTGEQGPVMIFVGLDCLSPEVRQDVVTRARTEERRFGDWVAAGVADGSVRDIDPVLTRFAIFGAMDWFPKWYHAGGPNSPQEIADCFANLFVNGLRPRR